MDQADGKTADPGRSGGPDGGSSQGGIRLSRRRLLQLGGGGVASAVVLAGAGAAGYEWPRSTPESAAATVPKVSPEAHSYQTRPDIVPPRVQRTLRGTVPEGQYYLLTPNHGHVPTGPGQVGLMMLDHRGDVVWFHPTSEVATNLQVQTYKGKPVLTWWQGQITATGHGEGESLIYDTSYRKVAAITGSRGVKPDLHELTMTSKDTALVTAYRPVTGDLRSVGGPSRGTLLDCLVQEVDPATGKVLFEWHCVDHVAVSETKAKLAKGPFDYFHINSIGVDPTDDNLIVSARNTWTLYKLDRKSGKVIWRLGGKKSNFTLGRGVRFAWQHHARRLSARTLTVFDDGASPAVEPQSRALHLRLDEKGRKVSLVRAFTHPARLLADNQGSITLLPNGGAVVGWGNEPYLTEFAPDGSIVLDGRLPTNGQSYRAFRAAWQGSPQAKPTCKLEVDDAGGYTAYVSWNGATEVAAWQAVSGSSPTDLTPVGSVPRAGFETAMTVHPKGKYVAMVALDAAGHELGMSAPLAT